MNILIVDNNINKKCWGAKDIVRYFDTIKNASITVRRGPHNDLPASINNFDKIIISGSLASATEQASWVKNLIALIKSAYKLNIPVFGICFGHQMIARALGGEACVRKAKQAEFGWTKIETIKSFPLFNGLNKSFYSFSSHFDETCKLPARFELFASSNLCAVQAFKVNNKNIFGVQFHPEKPLDDAKKTYLDEKKEGRGSTFLHANKADQLYNAAVGKTIFRNFILL